jgi:FtsP/CotA-like multicopper oxidase with cupredoxin domain
MPNDIVESTAPAPGASAATSRRAFLRTASIAAAAAGAGALVACGKDTGAASAQTVTPPSATGGTMPGHAAAAAVAAPVAASPASIRAAADAMDAEHEKGVKAFPAKTAGKGNQLLQPKIVNGVKVFELTASVIKWEVTPGQVVDAWAYNDQVPGPQIRIAEGDRVRFILHNKLPESTAIHFHGVEVPMSQDGVPFITQPPIKPGETFTYEWTAPNPGSHMYHSHMNATKQVGLGMLGALIIEPKVKGPYDRPDVDVVMILNDMLGGYTLNGKGFPATEPIVAKRGQTVRVRYMNEGMMIHPMHLHGMHQTVTHKDGWPLPAPYKCDTVNIAPGERYDVWINATNPGTWAFHCHILPHAESEHGMIGMVTVLVVQK